MTNSTPSSFSLATANSPAFNAEKCIAQVESKRAYNRNYYHGKVKQKRLSEKQELLQMREKCGSLETQMMQNSNSGQQYMENFEKMKTDMTRLYEDNVNLTQTIDNLKFTLASVQQALDIERQKNHALMMENTKKDTAIVSVTQLPKLENLKIS